MVISLGKVVLNNEGFVSLLGFGHYIVFPLNFARRSGRLREVAGELAFYGRLKPRGGFRWSVRQLIAHLPQPGFDCICVAQKQDC